MWMTESRVATRGAPIRGLYTIAIADSAYLTPEHLREKTDDVAVHD